MNKEVFNQKETNEFSKFIKKAVDDTNETADIYCGLIKQLFLKSYCPN